MKWIAKSNDVKKFFLIEEDSNCGFYIYVLDKGKCKEDYLQDSLILAMEFVKNKYGIEKSEWKKQP